MLEVIVIWNFKQSNMLRRQTCEQNTQTGSGKWGRGQTQDFHRPWKPKNVLRIITYTRQIDRKRIRKNTLLLIYKSNHSPINAAKTYAHSLRVSKLHLQRCSYNEPVYKMWQSVTWNIVNANINIPFHTIYGLSKTT